MKPYTNLLMMASVLAIFAQVSSANPLPTVAFHPPLPTLSCITQAEAKITLKDDQLQSTNPGILGTSTNAVEEIALCVGYRQRYQYGTIFYQYDANDAFSVHGDIATRYFLDNEQASSLGYPITDENGTPDGLGRFNHFQGGSIYWKPNLWAHALWGAIHDKWASEGWETNPNLGYPVSDMNSMPTGFGAEWWVSFENGLLYTADDTTTVTEVWGQNAALGYRTRAEVQNDLNQIINQKFSDLGFAQYISSFDVTDYTVDNSHAVHNRQFIITAHMDFYGYFGSWSDLFLDLAFTFELTLDRGNNKIWYQINSITGPAAGFWATGDGSAVDERIAELSHGQPEVYASSFANILDVKPMANGDLNVYPHP